MVCVTMPAVAPVSVALDPASIPNDRVHQTRSPEPAKGEVNTTGMKKAAEGPAFRKAVINATPHIKIKQYAIRLCMDTESSKFAIPTKSPE